MSNSSSLLPDNFIPESYRTVSVQPYDGRMTADDIRRHLSGKDAYCRTKFIILENNGDCSIAMISCADHESLFKPIEEISIVALPRTCVLAEDRAVDTANSTALAMKAKDLGLGKKSTLIVRGQDDHVNFIHHPNPIRLLLVEVVPPNPPKLLRMVQHVLTYADLPPIEIDLFQINLGDLSRKAEGAETFLVPCRSSGLNFEIPTFFLDEHPPLQKWVLLGCERSRQIHEHFYGNRPTCVETCPRLLTNDTGAFQIIKCCLLEEDFEMEGRRVIVPWGSNLRQIEQALKMLLAVDGSRV